MSPWLYYFNRLLASLTGIIQARLSSWGLRSRGRTIFVLSDWSRTSSACSLYRERPRSCPRTLWGSRCKCTCLWSRGTHNRCYPLPSCGSARQERVRCGHCCGPCITFFPAARRRSMRCTFWAPRAAGQDRSPQSQYRRPPWQGPRAARRARKQREGPRCGSPTGQPWKASSVTGSSLWARTQRKNTAIPEF